MRRLNTMKTLRFALAFLLLGIGIGLLIAGGIDRLEEDRSDSTRAGLHVEPAEHSKAKWGRAVGHGARWSALSDVRA